MSENSKGRATRGLIWAVVIIVMGAVFAAVLVTPKERLSGGVALPVIGGLPEFTLTNHLGTAVSNADLEGAIWVADIVFSRCPVQCVEMSRAMEILQSELKSVPDVRLMTVTTDPEFDTPDVLGRYGERFQADPEKWWFLTGAKPMIATLAGWDVQSSASSDVTTVEPLIS